MVGRLLWGRAKARKNFQPCGTVLGPLLFLLRLTRLHRRDEGRYVVAFLGPLQNFNTAPISWDWFSSTAKTIAEIMAADRKAEWSNESWAAKTHLAGSTPKTVQDRYLPLFCIMLIR